MQGWRAAFQTLTDVSTEPITLEAKLEGGDGVAPPSAASLTAAQKAPLRQAKSDLRSQRITRWLSIHRYHTHIPIYECAQRNTIIPRRDDA